MKSSHDYENDELFVTTREIKEGLKEGMIKSSQMECFDISSKTYDKLKKGTIKFTRLGKRNGVVDVEEEIADRKAKRLDCNYPATKCTCVIKKQEVKSIA